MYGTYIFSCYLQGSGNQGLSPQSGGITLPEDYNSRRHIPQQNSAQPSNFSSRDYTQPRASGIQNTYDNQQQQYPNANLYSAQSFQSITEESHQAAQYQQPYQQYPQQQYVQQSQAQYDNSSRAQYDQRYVSSQYPYPQPPPAQYQGNVGHPNYSGPGYDYGSPAGTMEGGTLSQSVQAATYHVPTSSGRAVGFYCDMYIYFNLSK